jgi:hypothetical protein
VPRTQSAPGWHNADVVGARRALVPAHAAGGYDDGDGSAAFFPLYPMATRAVSTVIGGHPLAAGILISNPSLLGALHAVRAHAKRLGGHRQARRPYAAVTPTSFFFLAPYSESTFLPWCWSACGGEAKTVERGRGGRRGAAHP